MQDHNCKQTSKQTPLEMHVTSEPPGTSGYESTRTIILSAWPMVAFSVYKFIPMSEGLAEILFDKRGSTERK